MLLCFIYWNKIRRISTDNATGCKDQMQVVSWACLILACWKTIPQKRGTFLSVYPCIKFQGSLLVYFPVNTAANSDFIKRALPGNLKTCLYTHTRFWPKMLHLGKGWQWLMFQVCVKVIFFPEKIWKNRLPKLDLTCSTHIGMIVIS